MLALATAGFVDSATLGCARTRPAPALAVDDQRLDPSPGPRFALDASRGLCSSTLILRGALAAVHDAASGWDRSGGAT